jgi:hypothetical protein
LLSDDVAGGDMPLGDVDGDCATALTSIKPVKAVAVANFFNMLAS